MDDKGWYQWRDETLILRVRVQPRASRDEIVGPHGEHLRVRITAPPVEGKANRHLLRFLAGAFGVPRSAVDLLGGEGHREKRISINSPRLLPAEIERPELKK